jgi:hypothetical protein
MENFKKLAQQQVPNVNTVFYTVPTGRSTIVRHIRVVNPTASPATIKLWHGGTADTNMILPPVSIDAGGWGEFDGAIEMDAGDTFAGVSDTNNALTITIYGLELG